MSGEGVQGRSLLAGGDAEVAAGGGQRTVSHEGVDDATVDANGQQSCSVAGGRRPPGAGSVQSAGDDGADGSGTNGLARAGG